MLCRQTLPRIYLAVPTHNAKGTSLHLLYAPWGAPVVSLLSHSDAIESRQCAKRADVLFVPKAMRVV
jgi:hypothetical protein